MTSRQPLAALPMYDFPHLRDAHQALWATIAAGLARRGIAAPTELSWGLPLEDTWRSHDLLLGQTCGYPLVTRLQPDVRIVATPVYDAEGCEGAEHRSAIVVRADGPWRALADLRGARCAINSHDSNSGMNLLRAEIAEIAGGAPFFSSVLVTGAHRLSLAAVADSRADVAAIDCVTLQLLRDAGEVGGDIRVLGWTRPSPSLPLITHASADGQVQALREALREAIADPALILELRALRIADFAVLPEGAYSRVAAYENEARAAGYPELI